MIVLDAAPCSDDVNVLDDAPCDMIRYLGQSVISRVRIQEAGAVTPRVETLRRPRIYPMGLMKRTDG